MNGNEVILSESQRKTKLMKKSQMRKIERETQILIMVPS